MRTELTRLQACALRSVHDESAPVPRATLELDLPQMRCTIRLTDREWRLEDRARDVVAAIDEMKRWMQQ